MLAIDTVLSTELLVESSGKTAQVVGLVLELDEQEITALRAPIDSDVGGGREFQNRRRLVIRCHGYGALDLQGGHELLSDRQHTGRAARELDAVREYAGEADEVADGVGEEARAGGDHHRVLFADLHLPDLPLEEASELESELQAAQMALVYMLAPTSTPARIAAAAQHASGFLYLVSLTGVTGARSGISAGLADFVGRVRQATDVPVAIGFGIATPEQAQTVGKLADGVIVGSALINTVDSNPTNPAEAAGAFVASLRKGLTPPQKNTLSPLASNAPLTVADPRGAAGDESYQGFLGC